MGLSGLRFWTLCSLFNVFIHVILLYCMSLLCPSLPTTLATSNLRTSNETDRLALLEFKANITDDPLHVLSSWNGSNHFCSWRGVTCSPPHHRVTILDLQSQKLSGLISPHIGKMSFLKKLYLQGNSFSHEIPRELGRLRRLQYLRLNNNSIVGEIPVNLSACSNLIVFDVSSNRLVGKIPPELGSFSKLQYLSIQYNNLRGGIPHSFGNLSSLQELHVTNNNIDGSIPDALGRLKNLRNIMLGENHLSGTIPPSIFNLTFLEGIDVTSNQIQGSLPSDIGITLPNIRFLEIYGNNFSGSIPGSISNATNLETLVVSENDLTGRVPTLEKLHKLQGFSIYGNHLGSGEADDLNFLSSLTNATNLNLLYICDNNFGGVLPKSISNFSTKLELFYIDNNQISGSIPTGMSNLFNLWGLGFVDNQLTGNIPIDLGKLQKLQELSLTGNKFSGNIPSSLGNLSMLTILALGDNSLQGSIPSSIGKCQNLIFLDLARNNLVGTIPREVLGLSSLSLFLNLSRNHLTGFLPMEVGNLRNLKELDVSENMLSGVIPSTLGSCVLLESLRLEGNFFRGAIPSSLTSLRGMGYFDLSRNNLSGKIPKYFAEFDVFLSLNLSFNDFEGEVPREGIFKNATAITVMGNRKLCGGIPELHLPMCNFKRSEKGRLTLTLILIVPAVFGLVGLILVLYYKFLHRSETKKKEPSSRSSRNLFLEVSYKSLFKATAGFCSTNLIGAGSFGSVFKGILDSAGTVIAVKVLNLQRRGGSKSFLAECEVLRNIRHRNLVKIISACSGVDYQGNDFKALVYEFMVNGSLEEWLHPVVIEDEVHAKPRTLCLLQRLNIAIDVACALDYIHHHCHTPIAHCDLKPSNVLLDDRMVGHVSDFGLARFLLKVANNSSANQTSSIGIKGSVGYAAPEYGMGSEVSTYGDVYSYGILLLEMFTGKRPTDEMFNDSFNLHNFAKMAWPERVMGIVDPILLQEGEEGETSNTTNNSNQSHVNCQKIQECLISMFRIAIACSTESPKERLDISGVVVELQAIKRILLGAGGIQGKCKSTTVTESCKV